MSLPAKAFHVLKDDGPIIFSKKSYSFIKDKFREYYISQHIDSPITKLELNSFENKIKTDSPTTANSLTYLLKEEKPGLKSLVNELENDDVFWDVGAHFGIYSVLASNIVDDDNIYTFEPNPDSREIISENFELNNIGGNLMEYALSNQSGEIELERIGTDSSGRAAINVNKSLEEYSEYRDSVSVQQIRGDELISQDVRPPDVMKLDVEGAEGFVLEGLQNMLENDICRTIYFELHTPSESGQSIEDYGFSEKEIIGMMEKTGYRIEVMSETKGNIRAKATKSPSTRLS